MTIYYSVFDDILILSIDDEKVLPSTAEYVLRIQGGSSFIGQGFSRLKSTNHGTNKRVEIFSILCCTARNNFTLH
jgi:hypothetical protein